MTIADLLVNVTPGSGGGTLCSFFYVDALARSGRLDQARLTFGKLMTYANHLGLHSGSPCG